MGVEGFNLFVGLGTMGLQIGTVVLFALFFFRKSPEFVGQVQLAEKWALHAAFFLTSAAAVFALVHEHVFGLEPCYWCWWQRICLFPQIIMLGMALFNSGKYKRAAIDFSIASSSIGALISLYHHTLQMFPGSGLPCPATGPSCAQIVFLEFGYITYPLMAFSLFAFVIVAMLFARTER